MNPLYEILIEFIRSRLLGSKDYFERAKKRLVRFIVFPLITILGIPPTVVAILSVFQYAEINWEGFSLKFFGEAASESTILAISVIISLLFTLGSNLYYALITNNSLRETKDLEDKLRRETAFQELMTDFNLHLNNGRTQEALHLGSYIISRYSDIVDSEPMIVRRMIEIGATMQISSNNKENLRISPPPSSDE